MGNAPYPTARLLFLPPFDMLHPRLQDLFWRCFESGYRDPKARPSANAWVRGLEAAENALVICSKNPQHRYDDRLDRCPWCDRAFVLSGRDPFPSAEQVRRQKLHPQSKLNSRNKSKPSTHIVRLPAYLPSLSHSLTVVGANAHSFWRELANCKTDLILGSMAILLSVGAAFYLTARPPQPSRDRTIEEVEISSISSRLSSLWIKTAHEGEVFTLAIAPDGNSLVSAGSEGQVKLWQLPDGKLLKTFSVEEVRNLALTKDGESDRYRNRQRHSNMGH